MDLLVGSPEKYQIKNVGVMMFSEQPIRFFPYMQVDIVVFPEGKIANPGKMFEVAPIVGPVHIIIKQVLTYLRINIIKEQILKVKNKAEAIRCF